MRKMTALKALTTAGAMLAAGAAIAASPVVDGTGKLTGATGVIVGGATFDVVFLDGTCMTVFGGCTSTSNFTFQTQSDAEAARDAILAQVLLGTYDANPGLTAGCGLGEEACSILVPYALSGTTISYASVRNATPNSIGVGTTNTADDLSNSRLTWARFSPASTSVPEPASWAMMLLGFAGIGVAVRRRRAPAWSSAA